MSLSVCICLSCRRSRAAEPGVEDVDMSRAYGDRRDRGIWYCSRWLLDVVL